MIDHAAPAGTVTEAFAWLATAMAVGGALGAAVAGIVADRAGPTAAFALAGGAGALPVLTTMLRSSTITPPRHPPASTGPIPTKSSAICAPAVSWRTSSAAPTPIFQSAPTTNPR